MATRYVSIGSQENIHAYDDGDTYSDAVGLTGVRADAIRCEDAPVNSADVLRLADLGSVFAPADALYITLATHASLPNERVLTSLANGGIGLTDNGAGGTLDIFSDINALATSVIAVGDFLPFEDISGGLDKKITFSNLEQSLAIRDFFNGTFAETFDALVTSDGATITLTVTNSVSGDLTSQFSSGDSTFTGGSTIALTAGSDAAPQSNYIYILESAPATLVKSTTAWPATEHIKVGYFFVPSAGFTQTNGVYINQNWNDHLLGTNDQGHMSHIAERSRRDGAYYFSGVAGNGTDGYLTPTAGNVEFISTAGVIYQMHPHQHAAHDTSAGDIVLVKNWSGDLYHDVTNLYDIIADSTGTAITNNKWFNLVFWGVANKTGEFDVIAVNLPSGFYNTQANAEGDVSGHDDFTIPREFNLESSVAFLIARVTIQMKTGGGTWIVGSSVDLRGQTPISASGGASSTAVNFPDNTFTVFDNVDNTKVLAFDVGTNVTTATTRTLIIPDTDSTIITSDGTTPFDGIQSFGDNNITNVANLSVDTLSVNDATRIGVNSNIYVADGVGLVIGHNNQIIVGAVTTEMLVAGTTENDGSIVIGLWSTTPTLSPQLKLMKSADAVISSNTIVVDDEELGKVQAFGDDGVNFATLAAEIAFNVDDATPAASQIGGEIVLATATSGGVLTTALRIDSSQVLNCSNIDGDAGNLNLTAVATGEVVINNAGEDVDFRVEGDANTNIMHVDAANDVIGFGGAASSSAGFIHVNPTGLTGRIFNLRGETTGTQGMRCNLIVTTSGASARGVQFSPKVQASGAGAAGFSLNPLLEPSGNVAVVYGTIGESRLQVSSSDVTTFYASFYRLFTVSTYTGTLTNAYTFQASSPSLSGSKPVNMYGFNLGNQGLSGITNAYGLRIEAQSGSTNNWNVLSEGATSINDFEGDVLIGADLTHTGSLAGFFNTAVAAQPAHIVDADGTLADITTKFNQLLADQATLGLQAAA